MPFFRASCMLMSHIRARARVDTQHRSQKGGRRGKAVQIKAEDVCWSSDEMMQMGRRAEREGGGLASPCFSFQLPPTRCISPKKKERESQLGSIWFAVYGGGGGRKPGERTSIYQHMRCQKWICWRASPPPPE